MKRSDLPELIVDDESLVQHPLPPTYWSLWYPKLQYFLYGAGVASFWGRFDSIWLGRHGFSKETTALMFTFLPFFFCFASFWGAFADKIRAHKYILMVCMLFCSLLLQSLNLLGPLVLGNFGLVSALLSGYWCCFSAQALLDTLILDRLGSYKELFGQQRLYQSISMALFGFLSGVIQNEFGWGGFFIAVFITQSLAILSIWLGLARTVSESPPNMTINEEVQARPGVVAFLRFMCSSQRNVVFMFVIVAFGMGMLIIDKFLGRYIEEELQGSTVLIGLDGFVAVISELPVMQISPFLIKKFGVKKMIITAHLIYIGRILAYTLFTEQSKWLIVFVEPVHGISFGCFLPAAIYYLSSVAPEGWEATAQGLFLGLFQGVGNGFGAIATYWLFQRGFSYHHMFFLGAMIMATSLMVYCASLWRAEKTVDGGKYGALAVEDSPLKPPTVINGNYVNVVNES